MSGKSLKMSGKYGENDGDDRPNRPKVTPSRPSSARYETPIGLSADEISELVQNKDQKETEITSKDDISSKKQAIASDRKGRPSKATVPGAVAVTHGDSDLIMQEDPSSSGLSNLDQAIDEKLIAQGKVRSKPAIMPGAVAVSGNQMDSEKGALKKSAGPAMISLSDEEAPLPSPVVVRSENSYDARLNAKIDQEIGRMTQSDTNDGNDTNDIEQSSEVNTSSQKDRVSGMMTAFVEPIQSDPESGAIDKSKRTFGSHPGGSFNDHGTDELQARTTSIWMICCCVLILVGAPVAIALGVIYSRDSDSESTTVTETTTPSSSPTVFYTAPPTPDLGLSLTAPNTSTSSWTPLAQNLTGTGENDRFGTSLSFSYNGTVVAVGAPGNIDGGTGTGQVQVFELSEDNKAWLPLGQKINGDKMERIGDFVFLSGDNKVLAISSTSSSASNLDRNGKVTLYAYNGTLWEQLGDPIEGSGALDAFGESVALNAVSPRRVIIGSSRNDDNGENAGHAKVFEYKESLKEWVQIGTTFLGKNPNDRFGSSVSMSASGNRISISAPLSDEGGSETGSVFTFDYSAESQSWTSVGTGTIGSISYGKFGTSLELSGSGRYIVVGSPRADTVSGGREGSVAVYENIGLSWILKGQIFLGENIDDQAGKMVAISFDGSRIAFSAGVGYVVVYEYKSGSDSWLQQGNQIVGPGDFGENFGSSLSLAANGYRVAVGADGFRGSAFVFEY